MTLVGVAGLLLGLSAFYIADLRSNRSRFVVFVLLFVLHAIASAGYYLVAESTGSDAHMYYNDTLRVYGRLTGLSTILVVNIVQFMREQFGGTFFDYFMVFQAIGFWGIIFLFKSMNEIFEELDAPHSVLTYFPLFLPGVHYWTSAIGKDAPLFFAVALAIWSCMRLNKRLLGMGVATAVMLAFRPHIAMISIICLGIASLVDSKIKFWVKTLMLVGITVAGGIAASSLNTTYSLDVSNADSVSDFMSSHSSVGEESGADMAIVQANIFMKVFTLWFRPLFLDAENSMGYIASMENLAIFILFGIIITNLGLGRKLARKVLFIRYSIIFFILLTALLAAVNFNVGLGLRQKMMAMPCLVVLFAAIIAVKAAQRGTHRPSNMVGYRPGASLATAGPADHFRS